jgi:DMSO/TMAO reductase YedYZ molybdopterin-dependent catalytic subunit
LSIRRSDRRGFLKQAAAAASAMTLAGCDRLASLPWFRQGLDSAETLTERAQRGLLKSDALAREYTEADLSPQFRANGTTSIDDWDYQTLAEGGFAEWELEVGGLVDRPQTISLGELGALPSRTQITRHDCVEGWSCIGKWKGVPLRLVLERAGLQEGGDISCFDAPTRLSRPSATAANIMRASASRTPSTRRQFLPTK